MEHLNQLVIENAAFFFLVFSGLCIFLVFSVFFLYLRIRKAPIDIIEESQAKNLEDILIYQSKTLKSLDKDIQELFNISNKINALSLKGIHKLGLVRFNPFKDVGGDQSFSLALLNGKNDGIVITSLYTREGARIYAKSISDGKSETHPLTEEEEKTIKIALDKNNKTRPKKPIKNK